MLAAHINVLARWLGVSGTWLNNSNTLFGLAISMVAALLLRRGGCARPTTTRVCVCVCVQAWGYRGMYAIIVLSRLCQEESLKGLKDQRHSTPFN